MSVEKLKDAVRAELGEGPSGVLERALEALEIAKQSPEAMEELADIESLASLAESLGMPSESVGLVLAEIMDISLDQALFLVVVARLSVMEGINE